MAPKRRWPTLDEVEQHLSQGVIDDTTVRVPLLDLPEWELLGDSEPGVNQLPQKKPGSAKRSPRQAA